MDPPVETEIADDMQITVERAKPVFIQWRGTRFPVLTAEKSVSSILSIAGIQREENDVVHPGLEEEISDGDIIKVVEVTYAEVSAVSYTHLDVYKRQVP